MATGVFPGALKTKKRDRFSPVSLCIYAALNFDR